MYDFTFVGAGFFNSTVAFELSRIGFKCLIVEKREHIGGNCYTKEIEDIPVHMYGPHIFHTNDDSIWNFINQFASFNNYRHKSMSMKDGKLYTLPFCLHTFYELWGVSNPEEAKRVLDEKTRPFKKEYYKNIEEFALSSVGEEVYETLIKNYTTKQWNKHPSELPAFIIKRLPFRLTFDTSYYADKYEGIPIGGYTPIFQQMTEKCDVLLNTDFFAVKQDIEKNTKYKIFYSGMLDRFYDFEYGKLDYRSLRFKHEIKNCNLYQGTSIVTHQDLDKDYTRIVEHKHFDNYKKNLDSTIITKEYPQDYTGHNTPYYPMNDKRNNDLYSKYKQLSSKEGQYVFGGRLADFKYYDMHQVIGKALSIVKKMNKKGI